MAAGYEATDLDSIKREDGWSPLRRHLDVQAFGVNAWTASEAGNEVIGVHDENPSGHEELYLVHTGRATFTVDGAEIDAGPGTVVFVGDPAVKRGAVATEAGTTIFAVGGKPGEAYRPRSWEVNSQVFALFDKGEFTQAKDLLLDGLERYDDRGALLYNLACAEAQLGDAETAFEYLRRGMVERPDLSELARDDADLAPLRDDPRFDEILGARPG
jgi:tetratricopeptide (TPR) repeat protein